MEPDVSLEHERIDDIPVIFAMAQRLGLAEVLDRHLGRHGNQRGLSYGWLLTTWIAYILSEGDHRKSAVEAWSRARPRLLASLTGQPIRPTEFSDDRLGRLLSQLGDEATWAAIEKDLWQQTILAYDLGCTRVRLDSTTTYGYHQTAEEGLMQLGHSKDHRPDQPQLKLMAAVAEPAAQLLAADVHPGQSADDGLYLPLIQRVRDITRQRGLLYLGDAKMAAVATRSAIVAGGDHYLTRLPNTGGRRERAAWIAEAIEGRVATEPFGSGTDEQGTGYQISRTVAHAGREWTERVLIYRSSALAQRQTAAFNERLAKAADALRELTPAPGVGRRQLCTEPAFFQALSRVEAQHEVAGLFWIRWRREPHPSRADPSRERFVVVEVVERSERVELERQRLGWQVLITDLSDEELSFADAIASYNDGWVIEQQFHAVKDRPLGIRPLFVKRDDQLLGLTRLITLALRIMTLITTTARRSLARARQTLVGLYEGQKVRATDRPTARRLLGAFYRAEITLTRIRGPAIELYHVTPLPPLLSDILRHLGLSDTLYADLAKAPAQ
jgi:transposase